MRFDEYQKQAQTAAQYPTLGHKAVYPTLGLSGEAGEVAEKVKKLMRNRDGAVDDEFLADIEKELGDVLWYLSQVATEFNLQLESVAKKNLAKLTDRKKRGVIKSEGDNR